MAYKFQLGASRLSGSVTFKEGLSANDQNITNVGDINVDSISADGTEMTISLTDNEGSSLTIAEGSNDYMKFDTSNGQEQIEVLQKLAFDSNTLLQFRDSDISINSSADGQLDIDADTTVQITAPSLDIDASSGVDISNNLTVGGNLTVNGTTTTIDTVNLLVEDSLIEIARGNNGSRASNANAGLYISGSTLVNDVSLKVAADGGRLKVSGSTAGFDVEAGGDYAIGGTTVLNSTTLGSAVVGSSLTSVGALAGGSIAAGFTAINVANVININSLDIDGATDIGENLADADLIMVDNGAGGVNRKATMERVKFYIEQNANISATSAQKLERAVNTRGPDIPTTVQNIDSAGDIEYFPITASATANISGSYDVGEMISIKGGSLVSDSVVLTISASHGNPSELRYTFDGQSTLTLESSHAAVDLIYISGSNGTEWIVM